MDIDPNSLVRTVPQAGSGGGKARAMRSLALAALALAALEARANAQTAPGCTYRESLSSLGVQPGNDVFDPAISPEGRFVAYWSLATNLVPNDANNVSDVFLTDMILGETTFVSVDSGGFQGDSASGVGPIAVAPGAAYIAFASKANALGGVATNGIENVYLRDRFNGLTTTMSTDTFGTPGNAASRSPSINASGRYVAFQSLATNLVVGDTNAVSDVFFHDTINFRTTRASVSTAGVQGNGASTTPAFSADGRWIAFASAATNLVAGDGNGFIDIFMRDRGQQTTTLVSLDSAGNQANGDSRNPSLSSIGHFLAFDSVATNLVPGDTNNASDVFVLNLATGATDRVSLDSNGLQANGASSDPVISADGRFVVFTSLATNLVTGDTNGVADVFVKDLASGTTQVWSITAAAAFANGASGSPTMSDDGIRVVFHSRASNLVSGDTNGFQDVYLRESVEPPPVGYCTAQVNSQGCYVAMMYTGNPSASAGSNFLLQATNALNNKSGLLFYSLTGTQVAPFQLGTLCMRPPLRRTPVTNSGGNPPPDDCSGVLSMDFNLFIASGVDPALVQCQRVWCQFWSRDPGFGPPNNTNLTDAVAFTIGP